MGNNLGRRRQVVDEKYTRPQGLYQHGDVDHKKLRKLILDSKLAPCYPGDDESAVDLEECPICFLYYPSLNRSRCCLKGICTECFLQMKTPNSSCPTQCPFCKTSNYAVEYRGVKSKEEKGIEQIEEQRVIEAKIRMRQQEIQDEEERMQKRQDMSCISQTGVLGEVEYNTASSFRSSTPSFRSSAEEIATSQEFSPMIRQPPCPRQNRDDDFDMDLEDLMVMEAIWLSIQEGGSHRDIAYHVATTAEEHVPGDVLTPVAESSSSSSSSLACAIAALAERQQMTGEPSTAYTRSLSAAFNMPPRTSRFPCRIRKAAAENCPPPPRNNVAFLPESGMMATGDDTEWAVSDIDELGTRYASSDATEDASEGSAPHLLPDVNGAGFQTAMMGPIVPESFEEQMMLAMAVSLAEARSRTNTQGVAWQ